MTVATLKMKIAFGFIYSPDDNPLKKEPLFVKK